MSVEINDQHDNKLTAIDGSWVGSAFLATAGGFGADKDINVLYAGADAKFTDTTPGGGLGINPKPQYTRYADPRRKGLLEGTEDAATNSQGTNFGMGRYYSDAHDDNNQVLTMNFGVPSFQSIFSFFSRAISYPDSVRVNQGRNPILYHAANGIATIARYIALPVFSIGLAILKIASNVVLGATDTRYYTMKPDMLGYWTVVNDLVNYMATERGIMRPELGSSSSDKIGTTVGLNQTDLNKLKAIAPDLISKEGYIDVFAIANRTAGRITERMKSQIAKASDGNVSTSVTQGSVLKGKEFSLKDAHDKVRDLSFFKETKVPVEDTGTPPSAVGPTKEEFDKVDSSGRLLRTDTDDRKEPGEATGYFENVYNYYKSMSAAGGSYARFNVEYLGSTTDTFSNSVKDIPLKDKFNGVSTASRDVRFSLSGGNVLGDAVDAVKEGATDVIAGLANGISAGLSNVIVGLLGGGFLDLPKMWDDSTVSLAQHQYKMVLTSPYGNSVSQLMNLDLPLAMILAATLPRATGSTSYGSPYLCSAFLRGYQDCDLGMITNLSVTRGVTNLGFNKSSRPLSLEVTFTVTDFSSLVVSPTPRSFTGILDLSLDDTKPLNKFLNTMAGRDFHTSKYLKPKINNRLANLEKSVKSALSFNRMGLFLADSPLGLIGEFVFKQSEIQ